MFLLGQQQGFLQNFLLKYVVTCNTIFETGSVMLTVLPNQKENNHRLNEKRCAAICHVYDVKLSRVCLALVILAIWNFFVLIFLVYLL